MMRLVLDRRDHLHERFDLAAGDAARDRLLEVGEVTVHTPGSDAPFGRRRNHERAPVVGADLARDETSLVEPIQDAGQGRPFVRQPAVQISDGGRRRGGEQRQDVRFALRQAVVTPMREV
jgi:hypothetical protein